VAFGNADSYSRFMGRFSEPLSPLFADLLEVPPGSRVLDVGCGPGVLTRELVARHGAEHVSAIDPAPGFVDAARQLLPGVDLREGAAESLPYDDGSFDATYAQLVVHFMTDPAQGLAEMARVTRPGGGIAACVWDHPGGRGPLTAFWSAVSEVDPGGVAEPSAGAHEGHLVALLHEAGLVDVRGGELSVTIRLESFEDWWAPYTEPAGSVGDYLARRTTEQIAELEAHCRAQLGDGPFEMTAWTWTATGRATKG
jgi:SAM-dependent methyltransferase